MDRRRYRKFIGLLLACATLGALALGVGVLTGCGGGDKSDDAQTDDSGLQDNTGDGTSLTILDWAGYDTPEFRGDWDSTHGDVKLNWVFANEDAEFFAKVASGFQADLLGPVWTKVYVDAGLIQPIDTSKLSNFSGIPDQLAALGQFDGKQYFVPRSWGYSGILYRTDKVTTPITSYADLWKPEFKGKISVFDSGEVVYAMSCVALGIDPGSELPADQQEQVAQKMVDFAKNCKSYWVDNTAAYAEFAAGNLWIVAGAWPSMYLEATANDIPAVYGGNDEGLMGWCGMVAVAKETKNYDLCLEFINAMISQEGQSALSNAWGQGIANYDAVPMIDPGIVKTMNLDDPTALDKTIFLPPVDDQLRDAYTDLWTAAKAEAAQ